MTIFYTNWWTSNECEMEGHCDCECDRRYSWLWNRRYYYLFPVQPK